MLERLGKVLHRTRSGYIVVELEAKEKPPPLNTPVYKEGARRIGILLDIIGPVKKPYAVIKPDKAEVDLGSGETLFYRRPERRPRARSRRGRGPRPPAKRGRKR